MSRICTHCGDEIMWVVTPDNKFVEVITEGDEITVNEIVYGHWISDRAVLVPCLVTDIADPHAVAGHVHLRHSRSNCPVHQGSWNG